MGYTVPEYVDDLRRLRGDRLDDAAMMDAVKPLTKKLSEDGSWFKERMMATDSEMGVGISMLHEEDDHSLTVIAVAWGEGDLKVPPHDHGTWAVVAGVKGVERNTLWERQDDGSHNDPNYAEVAIVSHTDVSLGDVISMSPADIHTVDNVGEGVSLSLHTYGQNPNTTDRYQYDTKNNRVKEFKIDFNSNGKD